MWPDSWKEISLEDVILRMTNGSNAAQFDTPFTGTFPITRIETIANETIDLNRVKFVKIDDLGVAKFQLKKGDILFSHINSDKHLGKTALFDADDILIHGINLLLIRVVNYYDSEFLNYLFKLFRAEGKFIEIAQKAVNQSSINQKKLKQFKIPLPPHQEQIDIKNRLNDIFGKLTSIQNRWKNLVLWKNQYVERSLIDSQSNTYYPTEKLQVFLEESTKRIGTAWSGIKRIGVSAKQGIIELDTGQKQSFENYKVVNPGDFVYNTMRINIGSIAQYSGTGTAITSPDYIVFRVTRHLSPHLLLAFLKSNIGLLEISSNTKGSVRSRLYFSGLSNINYPIAPVAVQQQANEILGWFSRAIGAWDTGLSDTVQDISISALKKAFKGELTQQNEYSESANLLYEKIVATKQHED